MIPGSSKVLAAFLPFVGFAAYRPNEQLPLQWLHQSNEKCPCDGVILRTAWHRPDSAILLFCFTGNSPSPSTVAKSSSTTADLGGNDESLLLARLGPCAQRAGIQVPHVLRNLRDTDHTTVIQTGLPGQPVAMLLESQPRQLWPIIDRLVAWLERWNRCTQSTRRPSIEYLDREILGPARMILPEVAGGEGYLDWLKHRCFITANETVPFVAAHNDLTMWNILYGNGGSLGVVDWEAARQIGYPLADFSYAMTDALFTVEGSVDRPAAFEACFASGGRYRSTIARYERQLGRSIMSNNAWNDLCRHACWLQHAVNEHRKSRPGEPRPFLEIVRRLAALEQRRF
jgi:hypothetical protein